MSAARPETGATGATDQQITEGFERWASKHPHWSDEGRWSWRVDFDDKADLILPHVVPPGTVIALAEHVTDAADREAIGRVARMLSRLPWQILADYGITNDEIARLERLRGSGGEDVK